MATAADDAPTTRELGRMLLERPDVPLTSPQDAPARRVKADVPVDGSALVDRRCHIEFRADTGWYLLTPLPREAGEMVHPRWILPSNLLPAISSALVEDPQTSFRVSGETTVYHDRVFILLGEVVVETPTPAPQPEPEPLPATAPATMPASAPTTMTASAPTAEEQTPVEDDSQDDILAALLADRPGRPLAASEAAPVAPTESVAPATVQEQLSEDRGHMRVDRVIVMARDAADEWWEARFESDNTLQDQPVRLLPCKLLERAEKLVAARPYRTVRLRISGEIIDHDGVRYMLLRKVLPQRDLGQF